MAINAKMATQIIEVEAAYPVHICPKVAEALAQGRTVTMQIVIFNSRKDTTGTVRAKTQVTNAELATVKAAIKDLYTRGVKAYGLGQPMLGYRLNIQ